MLPTQPAKKVYPLRIDNKAPLFLWSGLAIMALLALIDLFGLPSGADKALLLGLSSQRLFLALFLLACFLTCSGLAAMAAREPAIYRRLALSLGRLSPHGAMVSGAASFWGALLLAGFLVYDRVDISPRAAALAAQLGARFPSLAGYLDRLWPALMFLAVALAAWAVYVQWIRKLPFLQNFGRMGVGFAAAFTVSATVVQWVIFTFQLHAFERIPGWYWPILAKPDFARHAAVFAGFLALFFLIIALIQRFPGATALHLGLISLAFLGLQFSIGWMEGRGMASLTNRFFLSYHRVYIEEACNAPISGREAVINYENYYPSMFLQTKPPGVLWLSFQIRQAANLPVLAPLLDRAAPSLALSEPLPSLAARDCQRSMALVTFLFPLLSVSTIWILSAFTKRLIGGKNSGQTAAYASILFVLAPNIVMLPLFLDQSLYPPLFLLLAGGTLLAVRGKSWAACFLTGALLYGAIFLSFTMLPVLVVPVLYFALKAWQEKDFGASLRSFLHTLLPMAAGGLLAALLFKVTLNYDVLTRYRRMMSTRIEGDFYTRLGIQFTQEPTFFEKIRQTWQAAQLNNIELAVAIGFPVFVFFMVVGLRSAWRVLRRQPDETALINSALFLTYVGLNITRVVLGEAGRLWMFWIPPMALLAVQSLLPAMRRYRWLAFALVAMQIATVFLSYQFQDYLMPQLLP